MVCFLAMQLQPRCITEKPADMGYAYGYLLSEELSDNYMSLISSMLKGNNSLLDKVGLICHVAALGTNTNL